MSTVIHHLYVFKALFYESGSLSERIRTFLLIFLYFYFDIDKTIFSYEFIWREAEVVVYKVRRRRFDYHVSSVKNFDDATSLFLSFGCNCDPIWNELSKFCFGIVRFRSFYFKSKSLKISFFPGCQKLLIKKNLQKKIRK